MKFSNNHRIRIVLTSMVALMSFNVVINAYSSENEQPVKRNYNTTPPAPVSQDDVAMQAKSAGCLTCHTQTDSFSMHASPAVRLGCTDCHGGNSGVKVSANVQRGTQIYQDAFEQAHVLPRYPKSWHYPSSANPERTYTLLNRESPEFIRFINPSDYRIANESCGACHADIISA